MLTQIEDRKLQRARINHSGYVVVAVFALLIGRLWYLQVALGDDLLKASEANRIKLLRARAPRGTVFDRKGVVLATSRPQFVVMAVPEKLRENPETLATLCAILKTTPAEVDSIIQSTIKKRGTRPGAPVRIKIDVPLETVAQIGELRMRLPGVSVELDQMRYYPDGPAVAHIMGYLGEVSEQELEKARAEGRNYQLGDYVGKAGIEKQYDALLHGVDGGKQVEVNALGRVVRILGEKPSVPGSNLKLTIDRDLQIAADRAMGSQVGAVVAIDPRSGEVLAMVSKPRYDPNIFVAGVKPADWNSIIHDRNKPLQNRCSYSVYSPGSTFKPIVALAGLKYGECGVNTTVSCPGSFYFGRTFRCWKVHGGGVDFMRAIAESCNVWFYKLVHRLEIDRIAEVARQFGIGSRTGIDLPTESAGTMPDSAWKLKRFDEKWYPGETLSCAIGQGSVKVTPLQQAVACAAIAQYGKVMRPHLLAEVVKLNGKVTRAQPKVVREADIAREAFELVREGMRRTVTSGTGKVCDVEGVTVAGKTGSAQNPSGKAHGWFICFAPVENPEIAIACVVEQGLHGATSAAPVCRAVLDVYFGKRKPDEIEHRRARTSGD